MFALVLVLIPPSVALLTTTAEVDRLASQGAMAVVDAAERVELSRSLVEELTAIERVVRQQHQLAALGDEGPELSERYEVRRARFVGALHRLIAIGAEPALASDLAALREAEAKVHRLLAEASPGTPAYAEGVQALERVATIARRVADETEIAISRAAGELQTEAMGVQGRIARTAVLGIPVLVGLVGLAGVMVVRPMRRLDEAIRALGAGDLDRPVAIRGPGDAPRLGARLEWLRQQLLRVERDRERLLHHVSHQLKTPLTCIREGAQLLGDGVSGPLSPDQDAIARIIGTNARELERRIEELLRASEIQETGVRLEAQNVPLDEVVRRVLDQNEVAARARGVSLRHALDPVVVRGDPTKLEVAVDNLVTNAIKFSPDGGAVWVVLHDAEEILLVVEDEGPGIDPEERERVFEAFYQGRATWMLHVGGTGLGLAIAREYVRAHGGDVRIGSRDPGAQVVVTLPREAA